MNCCCTAWTVWYMKEEGFACKFLTDDSGKVKEYIRQEISYCNILVHLDHHMN